MTEILRIPENTLLAKGADGKFFSVPDGDPRGTHVTVLGYLEIDGLYCVGRLLIAPLTRVNEAADLDGVQLTLIENRAEQFSLTPPAAERP